MGEGSQTTAVHVEALQLLQATESSSLQTVQMRIITQIQLLQITHLTESTSLNPSNIVGEEPQNLKREQVQDRKAERVKEMKGEIGVKKIVEKKAWGR